MATQEIDSCKKKKITSADIDSCMNQYVANNEISGGALFVRKGGELVYKQKWGYSNLENKTPIEYNSIYRMMSMTKCVTAVAVMILIERGIMSLDDNVSKFVPEFGNMNVMNDKRYVYDPRKLKKLIFMVPTFSMKKVKREPAKREITIRDLLSHSSGLQQGIAGLLAMLKLRTQFKSLKEEMNYFSEHVLDFEPGTGTGYSPLAGFDLLGYIVSVATGMSFEDFIQKEICIPLGMKDTTFFLSDEQKKRLVEVYKRKNDKLINVTGTKDDAAGMFHQKGMPFEHGSGGLYSTIEDYEHFGEMLLNQGTYNGVRILKAETVELMHTEAPKMHLEPDPGLVWGLGMKIRQDPKKGGCFASEGTYGWSGAFGTHFFVSPKDNLEVVFTTNRTDLGGSGSYISTKVEELVFGIWAGKQENE